jgi:CRP-like cAMP-binding protein
MALFESATRSATATALTDVKLARLDRNQLAQFMNESTEFSQQVMTVLANRLRVVNEYIATNLGPA